jgi:hypothetical protein
MSDLVKLKKGFYKVFDKQICFVKLQPMRVTAGGQLVRAGVEMTSKEVFFIL